MRTNVAYCTTRYRLKRRKTVVFANNVEIEALVKNRCCESIDNTPEMESGVEKKHLAKLARVRENQRKSRARRQDHLRDLEQKVLGLQKELDRRDVAHRLSLQRLEAENRKLRDLHLASGVPAAALEAYLGLGDDPVMNRKIAIPAVQRLAVPVESEKLQQQQEEAKCPLPCSSAQDSTSDEVAEPPSGYPSPETGTRKEKNMDSKTEPQRGKSETAQTVEIPSLCACAPNEDLDSLPISARVINTTFCTIAEKLVDQYNSRGVDVSEIKQKLREGFFRSNSEEGCRVQNQILFQVLDEISGQ